MRSHALLAIFRRNFVSYFSSPIGYVFICAFVLLSAIAAFWPNDFFNTNLANLDQLNGKLPWIMLVFIPAITMSIWADERRQGTDELLLTLPATDFEIVLGKYLAAVAIFTVALVFSLSNLFVLMGLGDPDGGLVLANYFGYWCTGAAMIAIGMVASFLTSNLTVGFVLAAMFNAPLVFANYADAIIPWDAAARFARQFGFVTQFDDFGRGLVSLSSLVYYGSIVAVMIYLCMVLIGRRHWVAQSEAARSSAGFSAPMSAHYGARTVSLVVLAIAANVIAARFDLRADATSEQLSSLTPQTKALLKGLDPDRPVFIDAYISPSVPEQIVQTRLNLLNMLREMDTLGGDAVIVRINDTDRYSREASEAEELFGIPSFQVPDRTGGRFAVEDIYMGVAFMCGLDKVVVPFFQRGIPVEYEIIRSIATVSQQQRKRVGVLATDMKLFGGFDIQTMSRRADQRIITELRKQYEVVPVDPINPITERYDVLLAVQPSSLPQWQMDIFVDAVRAGQPTVVFEDPFPYLDANVPGTVDPRRPPQSNPFMQQQQQQPEPKGSIGDLWSMLGVRFSDRAIVWDRYNPYPKIEAFDPEFLFISPSSGASEAFASSSPATRDLQQVLMLFAGSIEPLPAPGLTFTPLMRTGTETGFVDHDQILQRSIFGTTLNAQRRFIATGESYVVAARIRGTPEEDGAAADEPEPESESESEAVPAPIDVILVSDLDLLQSTFFAVRAAGSDPDAPISFEFDNVTFVLNAIDLLAGDDRFIDIRSRRPKHRTLTAVEQRTVAAREAANAERERFVQQFEDQRAAEEAALNAEIERLQSRTGIDAMEMEREVSMKTQVGQNRLQQRIEALEKERDTEVQRIERELVREVRDVQNTYKLAAVALPPIPPLIVALVVLLRRRRLERIGVPATRMRGAKRGKERS